MMFYERLSPTPDLCALRGCVGIVGGVSISVVGNVIIVVIVGYLEQGARHKE